MPKYERSIVTYLDLLGFRGIIGGNPDPQWVLKLLEIFTLFSSKTGIVLAEPPPELRASCFSDLAVRATPIPEKNNQAILVADEGACVGEIQMFLISQGVLIRGAVTVGDIFIDDKFVFGPGLIKAYELESTQAKYPRVMLDPEVFQDLQAAETEWFKNTGLRPLRGGFRQDSDGVRFVDYLLRWAWHDLKYNDVGFIETHRDMILSGLNKSSGNTSMTEKYRWLCSYHNEVVESLPPKLLSKIPSSKDRLKVEVLTDFG